MSVQEEFYSKYSEATSAVDRMSVAKEFAEKPKLVPLTKTLDNGYKVTYYVGQKDVSVGNFPLAIDPGTAQILANQWGMHLPTGKMVSDIHAKAYREGTLVNPAYLSSSGFTDESGKRYSAEDVVQNVGSHAAILEGAKRIEEALGKINPNSNDKITVTNGKIIIQPTDASISDAEELSKVYFKGIPTKIKELPTGDIEIRFLQQGIGASPHTTSSKNPYTEYCTFTRLIGDRVEVTKPDGSVYTTTFASAMEDPNTYKAFTDSPKKPISYKAEIKAKTNESKQSIEDSSKLENKPNGKGIIDTITEGAKDLYEGAKRQMPDWAKNIFSQAEEFELMALSTVKKSEPQKLANQRTIKHVSRKRKPIKK